MEGLNAITELRIFSRETGEKRMKTSLQRNDAPDLRRRAFLGVVTAGGVASGLGCLNVLTNVSPSGASTEEFAASAFEPHVGSRFFLHGENAGPLTAELIESQAYPNDPKRPSSVRREPFTLIFRSVATEFEDQTCRISHPRLGTIEAYLSRVDQPKRGMHLQAVFG